MTGFMESMSGGILNEWNCIVKLLIGANDEQYYKPQPKNKDVLTISDITDNRQKLVFQVLEMLCRKHHNTFKEILS